MAVLVEAISVVIRADSLLKIFFGGWNEFKKIVPNQTLCADNEIVRVGFMVPDDVEVFIEKLKKNGLTFLRDNESVDIAVVDQIRGPTMKCDWLEFLHVDLIENGNTVAVCRLKSSELDEVITPPDWEYDKSLSSSYGFVPTEHVEKGLEFLRHENGLDVYFNPLTGEEVFVGRTDKT